jgi:hypothetical protein
MSKPTEILAMTWYRREDWQQLIAIFEDAHLLPPTYEQWLARAETGRRRYEKDGALVEKIYIDPKNFPAWCQKRSLKADAEARTQYANELLSLKYLLAGDGHQ